MLNKKIDRYDEVEDISVGIHHWEMTWMKGNILNRIKNKLRVIFSSNTNVKDLYKNGLQRDQFIPFIKILGDNSESENKSLASGVILSPKGTILHGNLSSDIEKRPRIKIYYTEPED